MTRIYQMNSAEKHNERMNNTHQMEQTKPPNEKLCIRKWKRLEVQFTFGQMIYAVGVERTRGEDGDMEAMLQL